MSERESAHRYWLDEISNAADDYREADERLSEAEAQARRCGVAEVDIDAAKNLWLR